MSKSPRQPINYDSLSTFSTTASDHVIQGSTEITSAALYHDTLRANEENTRLSGSSTPCPIYMLAYHQARMLDSILNLPFPHQHLLGTISGPSGLSKMRSLGEQAAEKASTAAGNIPPPPCKLRYALLLSSGTLTCAALPLGEAPCSLQSDLNITFFPPYFPPHPSSIPLSNMKWLVSISQLVTYPTYATRHKTSERVQYDVAYSAAAPKQLPEGLRAEVLVANERGEVMEGCLTTVYVFLASDGGEGGGWVTPAASCGGNLGTTRRWALQSGLCREGIVRKENVRVGDMIVLSNGVRGFSFGRIVGEGFEGEEWYRDLITRRKNELGRKLS